MLKLGQKKSSHELALSFLINTSNWAESHPRSIRHAVRLSLGLASLFALFNAGLFVSQHSRTPAYMTINGQNYGNLSLADAKKRLSSDFKQQNIIINTGSKNIVLNASQNGVDLDTEATFQPLTSPQNWQKIPIVNALSKLGTNIKPVYKFEPEKLAMAVSLSLVSNSVPYQNANVIIPTDSNQKVKIVPEIWGQELSPSSAADQIMNQYQKGKSSIKLKAVPIEPKWSALDVEKFMPEIENARRTSLKIGNDQEKIELSSEQLASLLKLDTTGSKLKIVLDKPKLTSFLESKASVFYMAPISTKTILKDGSEVARSEGQAGQQLDAAATADQVSQAFSDGLKAVTPKLTSVAAATLVTKTYSNSNEGLYKIIEDFAKSHSGSYRVATVELSGDGNRSAFFNADSKITTASTFKLFVAYGILKKIETGQLSLLTTTSLGSVDQCLQKMIVNSDNETAAMFQQMLGYSSFDNQLKTLGFGSTRLGTLDKYSTARDEMKLLTDLYNGQLLNNSSLDYLYGLMKRQVYRSGIPAGSHGSTVADKVGFLYGLRHDIGVVYSPKSTYALVILTDGTGGWTNINKLADEIYSFYNQ